MNIFPTKFKRALTAVLLLGSCLTAWAQQPIADGTYYIQFNNNKDHFLSVSGNNYKAGQPYLNTTTTRDAWILQKCSDGQYYYIIHESDGRYVVANQSGTADQEKAVHLETTDAPGDNAKFKITATSQQYNITPKSGNGNFSFNSWGGAGGDIGFYQASDGGSKWNFIAQALYVITFQDEHYLGGTSTVDITTFAPSTCIWDGFSGGTWKNASGYYLRYSNWTLSLTNQAGNASSFTLSQTESGTTGQRLYSSRYIRYNSGWTTTGTASNSGTNVVYSVRKVTSSAEQTLPTVSGGPTVINSLSTSAGTYTKTDASYQPACDNYIFYNNTNHYCLEDTYKGNTRPTDPISSYQWVLSGIDTQNATINNDGVINYKQSVTTNVTATVKVVATTQSGVRLESPAYTVTFKPIKFFYISITATAGEGGSVSTSPATLPTVCYGQNITDTYATTSVTFTATPSEGYAFEKWVDAGGNTISTTNPLAQDLNASSENQASPTAYTYKAIFRELPKFYYSIRCSIHTDYADGSPFAGQAGGTVSLSSSETKWLYGATPDATSATVTSNSITLTATASDGFSFARWTDAGNTQVSTDLQYVPAGFTVTSQNSNAPTVVTYTAVFDEFPIFYAKIELGVYEYLATTHAYSAVNKGSEISTDTSLPNGFLAIHGTSASQTSASQTVTLTARTGEGFGLRGWSTSQVAAANIGTGPYESSSSQYSKTITTSCKTKAEAEANPVHINAYFEEFPIFHLLPQTDVLPMESGVTNPGTASVEPSGTIEFHANSLSATEGTANVTFSATAKVGYKFGGWYTINGNDTTLVSTYNPYTTRIKSTSKDGSAPTVTKYHAQFLTSMLSIEADDVEMDAESDAWISIRVTPSDAWKSYIITSAQPSLVYVDNSGHCRSNATPGTTTIRIQGVTTDGSTPAELYTEITAKVRVKCKMPTISFSPSSDGTMAMLTLTRNSSDATDGTRQTTLFWTTDNPEGSEPVIWNKYNGSSVAVDPDATVYAKSVMMLADGTAPDTDYTESDITQANYVKPQVETPAVIIDNQGITFSSTTPGPVTYYYAVNDYINGTDPTTASYTGSWTTGDDKITSIASEKFIRVIGTKAGYVNSDVSERQYIFTSGTSGSTVILNDFEDHNWAYYAGRKGLKVGDTDEYYNDKYLYTLYSPDPRNVKITYRGYNTDDNTIILGADTRNISTLNDNTAPHVSNLEGEGQNTFIYYKTLEKFVIGYFTDNNDWNGLPDDPTKENYPYTVISNPFSVRPSTGTGTSKKYYGFAGWKIISGGKYIGRGDGGTYTAASDGDVLGLDELIHFVNLDTDVTYTPNCTSAEIVLEATWTQATRWSGNTAHEFTGGTYETNFIVASENIGSIEQKSPCTIIGMNPDGTSDNSTSRTITGLKVSTNSTTDPYDRSNCVKVEWIRHGNGTFDANGRNLTMGRGITSSSNGAQGNVYGNNTENQNVVNTVKVESGYYSGIANINNKAATSANAINSYVIMGCDYDRALANYYVPADQIDDNPYNIKLRSTRIYGPNGSPNLNRANGQLYMRSLFKSGVFGTAIGNEYYFHTYTKPGQRYIEMEGGYNKGHIKGGSDGSTSQGNNVRAMSIRMKGGRIDGQLACGSTSTFCSGNRQIVATGGRIGGWIAPGSNCSSGGNSSTSTTGTTDGTSYVYFGGTAEINSRQFGTTPSIILQSTGGVIYGSGLGYRTTDRTGEMTHGSNIVFADDAYCERGIYGGGALGQTLTTANIFILGGRVGTGEGQIKDQGANKTYTAKAGVYGGACYRGGQNSFIYMDGGIVESGIYGGANISGTMTGNTSIKIVGGQVGYSSDPVNVHGGGYGDATIVSGNVDVSIGNRSGEYPTCTVSGDAVIYGDVYGGSALGRVNGTSANNTYRTNVTLNAGTIYGSLYGGALGNASTAANVYGPVAVKVYGGSVKKTDEDGTNGSGCVFGANNINGAPQRAVTVDIYRTDTHSNGLDGEPATADDEYALYRVFGGGNQAPYTYGNTYPKVTIHDCDNSIGSVYGGGNQAKVSCTNVTIKGGNLIGRVFGGCKGSADSQADVDGDVNLSIYGGRILKAFGGNDSGGEVKGNINLLVSQTDYTGSSCPIVMDYLYGGGNNADSKTANMDIRYADNIDYVFGGACAANMDGSINLNIVAGNIGTVFGGNDQLGTISGDTISVTVDWWNENHDGVNYEFGNNSLGSVYGGGNIADYDGNTVVKVLNAHLTGNVYGGGKKADIGQSTQVIVGDWSNMHNVYIEGDVYGGGDNAAVKESTQVTINDCATLIDGDVYGGGNAAEVGTEGSNAGSTCVNVWAGTMNRVFGGGHGYPTADPVIGADIYGSTNVNFYGGTANGIFGGSNSVGNITGTATVFLDEQVCPDPDDNGNYATEQCDLNLQEVYGAGNEAFMEGQPVLNIGCVSYLGEIYGGSRNADINQNIVLNINSGTIRRVFGGNNEGGCIKGSIKVNIEETGCHPIVISELYGCGNKAAYSVYGYDNTTGKPITQTDSETLHVDQQYDNPEVNIISCTSIGTVYGGGLGEQAVVSGSPEVHIDMVEGVWSNRITNAWGNRLGTIGTVFGGGNAAKVDSDTYVNIGTDGKGANISGNVYGGGNAAKVEGQTYVQIGQ